MWWTLLGCAALGPSETDNFLDAHERIIRIVQAHAEAVETPVRHGKGDGDYLFEGTLLPASGEAWTGAVDISGVGTAQQGGTRLAWSLALHYDQVDIAGVTLDGDVDATLSMTIDQTVALSDVLRGTLDLGGEARAEAVAFDYGMLVSSEDPVRRFAGTLGGKPLDVALD